MVGGINSIIESNKKIEGLKRWLLAVNCRMFIYHVLWWSTLVLLHQNNLLIKLLFCFLDFASALAK
jgi:hypothetical protein